MVRLQCVVVVVKFLTVLTTCREYAENMVISKLKYMIEPGHGMYHPTVLMLKLESKDSLLKAFWQK
jgi:hypothetical protein